MATHQAPRAATSLSPGQAPPRVIMFRCAERIAVTAGGLSALFLGAWLFSRGLDQGGVSASFLGFILNGQGPGLAFMAGGIWLLYHCLKTELKIVIQFQTDTTSGQTSSQVTVLGGPGAPPDETEEARTSHTE